MWNAYVAASALLYAILAVMHLVKNNQPMVSRDWAEQRIHECIVASPCRFCPALNLGLRTISLSGSGTR